MHFLVEIQNALSHFFGLDNLSGPFYGFWSGSGSDIAELALVGGIIAAVRHLNCGVKGCWRLHRYEYDMDGVKHKVCRHHHPALGKQHHLKFEHLLEHHSRKHEEVK